MSRLLFKGKVNSIIFTLHTSLVMSENRQVRKHLRGYITVSFGALDHMKFCKWVHAHITSITSEGACNVVGKIVEISAFMMVSLFYLSIIDLYPIIHKYTHI